MNAIPGLVVNDLHVTFKGRRKFRGGRREIRAVRGVSFELAPGGSLGLVGESGSGKSTTGRAIVRLLDIERGTVTIGGVDFSSLRGKALRSQRRSVQMIFQDSNASLDPSLMIGDSIAEPISTHLRVSRAERAERVGNLLERVGLSRDWASRYPHSFSGGQRQRIAIARALAAEPKVVILDESLSGLDSTTQTQVIGLLEDLRASSDIAYLFITHDLAVAKRITDRVAVMYAGQIVELAPTADVFASPRHPYTQALLAAVPVPVPWVQRAREPLVLEGEPPDPARPVGGCPFATRCFYVMDKCRAEAPPAVELAGNGIVRCHLHADGIQQLPTQRKAVL